MNHPSGASSDTFTSAREYDDTIEEQLETFFFGTDDPFGAFFNHLAEETSPPPPPQRFPFAPRMNTHRTAAFTPAGLFTMDDILGRITQFVQEATNIHDIAHGNNRSALPESCRDMTTEDLLLLLEEYDLTHEEDVQRLNYKEQHRNEDTAEEITSSKAEAVKDEAASCSICLEAFVFVETDKDPVPSASKKCKTESAEETCASSEENANDAEAVKGMQTAVRLPVCGHHFHKMCMRTWIESDRYTCPLCRQPLIVE